MFSCWQARASPCQRSQTKHEGAWANTRPVKLRSNAPEPQTAKKARSEPCLRKSSTQKIENQKRRDRNTQENASLVAEHVGRRALTKDLRSLPLAFEWKDQNYRAILFSGDFAMASLAIPRYRRLGPLALKDASVGTRLRTRPAEVSFYFLHFVD